MRVALGIWGGVFCFVLVDATGVQGAVAAAASSSVCGWGGLFFWNGLGSWDFGEDTVRLGCVLFFVAPLDSFK